MSLFRRNLIANSLNKKEEGVKPCIFRVNSSSEVVLLTSNPSSITKIYLGTGEEIEFAPGDTPVYYVFDKTGDVEVYFEFNPEAINVERLFGRCTNLISVPNTLFKNIPNLASVFATFMQCINLIQVPEDIFKHNKFLNNFTQCFSNCTNLQGESPKNFEGGNLWEPTSVVSASELQGSSCFMNCTNLSDYANIPEEWRGYV